MTNTSLNLNILDYLTPGHGIHAGVNKSNFKNIELWYQAAINDSDNSMPKSLGLFGPASVGKTHTINTLTEHTSTPLLVYNCGVFESGADFFKQILLDIFNKKVVLKNPPTSFEFWSLNWQTKMYTLNNLVVLFDEAHLIPKKMQGQLLSILDGTKTTHTVNITSDFPELAKSFAHRSLSGKPQIGINCSNVKWVFATTDSSDIVYPLLTRMHPITMSEYPTSDVVEILKLRFGNVLADSIYELLATASKLVPRIAIRNTYQYLGTFKNYGYSHTTALSYVTDILNTDENGLGATDYAIIEFLKNSKVALSKADQASLIKESKYLAEIDNSDRELSEEEIKQANASEAIITKLRELETSMPCRPRAKDDISTFCRLYDTRDLELRLGYLERLGIVTKTKSGVMFNDKYSGKL